MISTKNTKDLPDAKNLQKICKAVSVLDAIISQDWHYRYYSYNNKWADNEEVFTMKNGEGDELFILFKNDYCVINGFAHEFKQQDKTTLMQGLPKIFEEFIFGEPIKSIGTTFCIWTTDSDNWHVGQIDNYNDNSQDMLKIFDNNPQTYIDWATEYFEDSYKESGIPLKTVNQIYKGEALTKKMILSIVDEIEDWEQLKNDLKEIHYPYNF